MSRPSSDQVFIDMAKLVSTRGTCARRQVGCVLVNSLGHVVATGYNGTARSQSHCIDKPCAGAACKSGEGLDLCEAIHAEQNALLQCKDVMDIDTAFCTDSPCVHCVKLLLNTSCRRIVYWREYPHNTATKLWTNAGRKIISAEELGLEIIKKRGS